MARTPEGKALTELHQRQQAALRARVIREVMLLWPLWVPADPTSYQAFEEAMVLLVRSRSQTAAALAARYMELFKAVDAPVKVIGATVPLAALPAEPALRRAIEGSVKGGLYRALAAGKIFEEASRNGLVQLIGTITKEIDDVARQTILDEVARDDQILGYCRATGGNPCAFCAMLASRGPVYKGQQDEPGDHAHGACYWEPVYKGSEWPGRAREFQQMWNEAKASKDPGVDPALNFRQFYEERGKYAPGE